MKRTMRGIIFDMDNTIVRSRIDFGALKRDVFQFLVSSGILPAELDIRDHTSSSVIEQAIATNLMTKSLSDAVWEIAKRYEIIGMQGADLEPGTVELLDALKDRYLLVVITNNSIDAAEAALRDNGIYDYFDHVVGRETMASLKPSPDGFITVLKRYGSIPPDEWISVGDSWVDGKASIEAGVRFIAYQADVGRMNRMGVHPYAEIDDIRELKRYV